MNKIKDLINVKFNMLTVIKFSFNKNGTNYFECLCECKNKSIVSIYDLYNGHTKSCGCFRKKILLETNIKHGMSKTRFYEILMDIKKRTTNENRSTYNRYGGRGIKICKRWEDFINFKNDMYESYLKHCTEFGEQNTTIDRIDNNGNYEKQNCKWSTLKEQCNNRSSNVKVIIKGIEYNSLEMVEKFNLTYGMLQSRIKNNWNEEDIIKPKGYRRIKKC